MKFKKLVVYGSFAFSTFSLIAVLHNQKYNNASFEQQQETITKLENEVGFLQQENLKLQNQLENITTDELLSNIMRILKEEAERKNIVLSFDTEKLSISINNKEMNGKLSDTFYKNLNQFMICANIKDISLYYLGNEIDFSKVNLSTVKNLHLYECREDLDCSFFTQKYDCISFDAVPTQLAIDVIENCDCSDATISCGNIKDVLNEHEQTFIDIDAFAHYLVENNVNMEQLYVSQWSYCMDGDPLTMEAIETLSHVNTKKLSITSIGESYPINLDLELHENIQDLYIRLPVYVDSWEFGIGAWEFGDIKISSQNPSLNITFANGFISNQTHFELPESSTVRLLEVAHNSVAPLYELSNVKKIEYVIHLDTNTVNNLEFATVYDADMDNFISFIEEIKYYWDTTLIEEIEYYWDTIYYDFQKKK